MIHEIAGYTFYLRNVVCIHPLFEDINSTAHLTILTTGGEITVSFPGGDMQAAKRAVSELIEAMHMQSDDDRNWGADEPR